MILIQSKGIDRTSGFENFARLVELSKQSVEILPLPGTYVQNRMTDENSPSLGILNAILVRSHQSLRRNGPLPVIGAGCQQHRFNDEQKFGDCRVRCMTDDGTSDHPLNLLIKIIGHH